MQIKLAKSAGFCFGVKRALDIAFKAASSGKMVFMLGDIVHNEAVVKKVEEAGVKKINRLRPVTTGALLIRAHGAGKNTFNRAKKLGYEIIDATCPMVKEIHKIARKLENQGYRIIIIGDKKHAEVTGICGQLNSKALVIEGFQNIPLKKIKKIAKAGIVIQSTQLLDHLPAILKLLHKHIPKISFHNTICNPTRAKQNEIKAMPLENDLMIIIGSKTSANTKRIYEISRSLNKNSYWVNSAKQIKKSWLANAKSVGVTAGASTPESTIREVIAKIEIICPA